MSHIAPEAIEPGGTHLPALYDALNCLSLAALFTETGEHERASGAMREAAIATFGFEPGSDEAECLDRLIAIVRRAGSEVTR